MDTDSPSCRSPDRDRPRYAPPADSYIPSTSRAGRPRSRSPGRYRPRSRTPPRISADTWRGRPRSRSPTRRYESRGEPYPPRDARLRSPRREYTPDPRYDEDTRQSRARSPLPLKRARETTPTGRSGRSPPPPKRERVSSPSRDYARPRSPIRRGPPSPPPTARAEYRTRSRTPPRRDNHSGLEISRFHRRRTPSPRTTKVETRSGEVSGRESVATSRRSSPRPLTRRPDSYRESHVHAAGYRSPRARSPLLPSTSQQMSAMPTARTTSPVAQNIEAFDGNPKPSGERMATPTGEQHLSIREIRAPPTGPIHRDNRAPPTGPSGSSRYGPSAVASVIPESGGTSVSMSAHNRASTTAPPAYPRAGGSYRGRGGPQLSGWDYSSREQPPPTSPTRGNRPGWGSNPSFGRGGSPRDAASPRENHQYESRPVPSSRGRDFHHSQPSGFRGSGNSTSTTYPRTQRFNVPTASSAHLSDLPSIKAGGEQMLPLHDMSKADRLEEEAARLRKLIDEKQGKKRQSVRDWEGLERQSKTAGLRTELAEESLRSLSEEGSGLGASGVAAF